LDKVAGDDFARRTALGLWQGHIYDVGMQSRRHTVVQIVKILPFARRYK
jgi:hypothetical protein